MRRPHRGWRKVSDWFWKKKRKKKFSVSFAAGFQLMVIDQLVTWGMNYHVFTVKSQQSFYCLLRITVSNFGCQHTSRIFLLLNFVYIGVLVLISAGWFPDKTLLLWFFFLNVMYVCMYACICPYFLFCKKSKHLRNLSNSFSLLIGVQKQRECSGITWKGHFIEKVSLK